jgi:hypothetical protein
MAVGAVRWPGKANVVVSLLVIFNGDWKFSKWLNGNIVASINSHLEDDLETVDPTPLPSNKGRIFQGVILLGDGFLLDETAAQHLIADIPSNIDVIRQIINGQEVNQSPSQSPGRWTIDFYTRTLEQALQFPELLKIVEEKVKPLLPLPVVVSRSLPRRTILP